MIIRKSEEIKKQYHKLGSNDTIIGIISSRYLKSHMLIDLLERGVRCLPSPLSQTLNSSKVAQAFVFKEWMLPYTCVVNRRVDLIDSINQYNINNIGPSVTKEDHRHCGMGIKRWESIENVYSSMAMSENLYPFIIQPFMENCTDVRVIIVDDYVEAYVRYNPNNFRKNISMGGKSSVYNLDSKKEKFCRHIMERGKFPYAHIDIMILDNDKYYLMEISLNGGIKGAKINGQELDKKKQDFLEKLATT